MENTSPSLSGNKRQREEKTESKTQDSDQTLSLEESLTFSDTLVALQIMRAQFPHLHKVSIQPFILRSQLYSSIKDRTQADRELELLRRDTALRIFKLNTGQDDHAIMFMDDYLNQIKRVVTRLEAKKQDNLVVFEWFKTYVIPSKLETSIGHEELCSFLSSGGNVKDQHISLLINAGLLGRKELLSFLNRRKYKEMMLASLEKKNLRLSPLDMRFHLRDLIGSGQLKTVETSSGLIVQVVKD
ncbi:hypothetical protein Acr_28g0010000 [Actinidia rufa]|uniref:Uncharacterized protein n=1 Tax=Actinidia rufa TaxID=165716 RepID=A0A7J0HBE7_9ERIC|nr:hypothetical protein Acr_28g0010000 [Actinidia rufa]